MNDAEKRARLRDHLDALVSITRSQYKKDPEHANPNQYTDDLIRDTLEDVLYTRREQRR